jgi:Spy/CpxP family protein refolding chaperone
MKKRRILVTMFAIALGIVMMSTTPVDGGKGLPDRWALEEDGSKGERGKNGRHQGRRWNRGGRILRGLDLTEDQRQQMGEIKRLFREEVRELYTAHRENMRGVLTPGQQDTLRMRMERIKIYRENNRPGKREENPREGWPDHWRGNFPDRINTDEDGAAKPTVDKPVATEGATTTWGKIKNLFE